MTRFARAIAGTMIAAFITVFSAAGYGVAAPPEPVPCPKAESEPVDAPVIQVPEPGTRLEPGMVCLLRLSRNRMTPPGEGQ